MIVEQAPAKLNLSLEVTGRRADGYHELVTLVQTVDLADELTFEPADDLALECDDATLDGPDNLVLRAARALSHGRGAHIRLVKRIPIAAGLGGGSSDAAATLRGLARLWGERVTDGALLGLARTLGADVPFLLRGGVALATGVGDDLEALPDPAPRWAVLHTPEAGPADKTARAYRALRPADWSDGFRTRRLAELCWAGLSPDLADAPNAFERVADELFPSLANARRRLQDAGAAWVRLTGAGPTLFTLLDDAADAQRLAATIGQPARTWCVPTVGRLG